MKDDVAFVQMFSIALGLSARLLAEKPAVLCRAAVCFELHLDVADPTDGRFVVFCDGGTSGAGSPFPFLFPF